MHAPAGRHPVARAAAIPILKGIAPLAPGTRAWLVDLWGVLHNGVAPFAPAVAACCRYRREGGLVLLLVERAAALAAWRRNSTASAYARGVGRDRLVGRRARALIARRGRAAVFHLGPERDLPLYEGLDVHRVAADSAEAVVCTGLFDDETETPADYVALLAGFSACGSP